MALLCFSFLIFIHELGHFLAAKAAGITVLEFAIGMGPALLQRQKGETIYSLRLFPLGGYCQMDGEDEESCGIGSFGSKSVWARIGVVLMGSVMNLLTGFLLVMLIAGIDPIPSTVVAQFAEDPAPSSYELGLREEDRIIGINDTKIHILDDLSFYLARNSGKNVSLTVLRQGESFLIEDFSFPSTDYPKEEITGDSRDAGKTQTIYSLDFYVYPQNKNPLELIEYSFFKSVAIVKMVWFSLFDLVRGEIPITEISGPVGVTEALGTAAKIGWQNLCNLLAIIAINLGVVNLMPLPALDGGRLMFLAFEAITRRRVPVQYEGVVHYAGFILLMLLSVFLIYNDVVRLIL